MAKRGSYKCGKCGETGHNARRCPGKAALDTTVKVTDAHNTIKPEVITENKETKSLVEKKVEPDNQVAIDTVEEITAPRRKNTRPPRPASPYECPTCQRVGILVLVELEDGTPQLRCEHCHTKVRCKVILKWGAAPVDKPADVSRAR